MSEFVNDLHQRIVDELVKSMDASSEVAGKVATKIMEGLCDCWGGNLAYVGKLNHISARNRAIIRDHKAGERVSLLSRRYNLSRIQIWKIINR